MKIAQVETYTYNELDDTAQESARDWWREYGLEYEWWDSVFEDIATYGAILGIDIRCRRVTLMNGDTRLDPDISFSGFSHQGSGACYSGTYRYSPGWRAKLQAHLGKSDLLDSLEQVGYDLQTAQKTLRWTGEATITGSERYFSINLSVDADVEVCDDVEEAITDALVEFGNLIYQRLQREYEYLTSDEQVAESILDNEYSFRKNGTLHL